VLAISFINANFFPPIIVSLLMCSIITSGILIVNRNKGGADCGIS